MSFIDLFRQPKVINKPYKWKNCSQRFRFKAHAVNHRRQHDIFAVEFLLGRTMGREILISCDNEPFMYNVQSEIARFSINADFSFFCLWIELIFGGTKLAGTASKRFARQLFFRKRRVTSKPNSGFSRQKSVPPCAENRVVKSTFGPTPFSILKRIPIFWKTGLTTPPLV